MLKKERNMKKWIPIFLIAFSAGILIGGFLAEKTRERRMRSPRKCETLSCRGTALPILFSGSANRGPGGLYLRINRNEDGLTLLISFSLSSPEKNSIFCKARRINPEAVLLSRRTKSSRLLSLSEFLPGGVFREWKPDEICRSDSFELGYSRLGRRIYLLENIPEEKSALSESPFFPAGKGISSETHWIPVCVLLVSIVLGFLLLAIQRRREG